MIPPRLLLLALLPAAVRAFSASPNPPPPAVVVTYQVCLSPTCVDDGARATFDQLQAFAPPGLAVVAGGCCNNMHCGHGPVVTSSSSMNNNSKKKNTFHRNIKDARKILELLLSSAQQQQPQDDDAVIPEALVNGYNTYIQAEEAFRLGQFETADILYETAMDTGLQAAMDLQKSREIVTSNDDDEIPPGLLWVIQAHRHWAATRLALHNADGAVTVASKACQLSHNRCTRSLDVLAEAYQQQGAKHEELAVLQTLFDLNFAGEDTATTTTKKPVVSLQVENRRREQSFRKATLERDIAGQPMKGIFHPEGWVSWTDHRHDAHDPLHRK